MVLDASTLSISRLQKGKSPRIANSISTPHIRSVCCVCLSPPPAIRVPTTFRQLHSYINYTRLPVRLNSHKSQTMTLENDTIAGATLELLEVRLRRLEYLLTGDANWTGHPKAAPKPDTLDDTVARRLARLEAGLEKLSKEIPAVHDVLQLR